MVEARDGTSDTGRPEPVTSAPRIPRPTTLAFIVIGSSFSRRVPARRESHSRTTARWHCVGYARGTRLRLKTRVFGIRQVWRSDQQSRYVFANPFVDDGAPPREWAERLYNVRRWTSMPSGGHFAAVEEPKPLAREIAVFFAGL